MKVLDLFSGIGGFSLGLERAGMETVAFCEFDEHAQKVLRKHWPDVPIHSDIRELDAKQFRGTVDVICGGFPCQDLSTAGKQVGFSGERSSLYGEMLRVISEVRPKFVIIENVPMLTIRGGTRVIEGLAEIGYDSEWTVVGANEVGARHIRKRLWIVAYTDGIRQSRSSTEERAVKERLILESKQERAKVGSETKGRSALYREESKLSNTDKVRRLHSDIKKQSDEKDIEALSKSRQSSYDAQGFISDTHSKPENGADYWAFEPSVGRVVDGIPDWVDRIKGLGNAIVPQVARVIMERIKPLI